MIKHKRVNWTAGDRVHHRFFGAGTVQKVERSPWRVTVFFDEIQDTRTISGCFEGMHKDGGAA